MRHGRRSDAPLLAAAVFFLTASACTSVGDASSGDAAAPAQGAAPAVGQVVAEIDPRIWCVHQERDGDFWFGSNGNGVYRYDGRRIIHYTRADGLSGNQVRDIEEDNRGNLFIATTEGVNRFDGTRFTTLEVVKPPDTGAGWVLDPDDVWLVLGSGDSGPGRFDGERLYRLKLPKSPAEDAHRARFPDAPFPPAGVYSIYSDRRGHLWFGTASVGLCRYDGQTLSWIYEERLTTTPAGGAFGIRSVYQDRAGDFWICNTRQRFEFAPDITRENGYSLARYRKKAGLPDAQSNTDRNFSYCHSFTEDNAGALWMACGTDGVWKYDGKQVTRYPIGDGAYAFCLYHDRQGKLWLGTSESGIHTLEGDRFKPFKPHTPDK